MANVHCDAPVIAPTCPKCGRTAKTVETAHGARHHCCDLHSWRGKRLVDRLTHELRKVAHEAIDPLWQSGKLRRSFVYQRLAAELRISGKECHIGLMDPNMLRRAIAAAPRIAATEDVVLLARRKGPPQPRCDCGKLSSIKRLARNGDRRCKACIKAGAAPEPLAALATPSKAHEAGGN